MTKKKIEAAAEETETQETVETRSVTWRMPKWIAEVHAGDWTDFRGVLDAWAEEGEPLEDPDQPEETTSVCMRLSTETFELLDQEAQRRSKMSKRKWTAGKVARLIYEDQYEKPA